MSKKNNKEVDFAFHLSSYSFFGRRIINERYRIMRMEDGLKAPAYGKPLDGEFTKEEKKQLEALLVKVQSPGFKS